MRARLSKYPTTWAPWSGEGEASDFETAEFPCPLPVGGIWVPTNKTVLLAPYIGLASLIGVAAASVVYINRRKKKHD